MAPNSTKLIPEEEACALQNCQEISKMDNPTQDSDLSDANRSIHIVTTAALPWMTGTAVNPLLRALYFQRSRSSPDAEVTLMIPWVEKESERLEVYGSSNTFSNGKKGRKEQELFIRKWATDKARMEKEAKEIKIQFYPARYKKKLGSILTLVDLCSLIPEDKADVAILEEPEHLTWLAVPSYQNGVQNDAKDDFLPTSDIAWQQKFKHVVGIIHTNYPAYARSYGVRGSRRLAAKSIKALVTLVCRAYCHKIVKLSATLPVLAEYKECVCNVHGVRSDFLRDSSSETEEDDNSAPVYFIGKVLWAKGFDFMLKCQQEYHEKTGEYFPMDIYGHGPDVEEIKRSFFGVRKKENKIDTTNSDDQTIPISEEEHTDEPVNKEDDEQESFYSRLTTILTHASPFLMDGIEDDTNEKSSPNNADDSKLTTLQTIKDSFKVVKSLSTDKFHFDLEQIPKSRYEWRKTPIPARFLGQKDHAALKQSKSKIFFNPSITEVLCTTSAEALAMGKFVILPVHPSNEFFYQFPNCLAYKDMEEFVQHMKYALSHDPKPLTPELSHIFTWEAAMDRLIDASIITEEKFTYLNKIGKITKDKRKAWIHQESGRVMKGDVLKGLVGDPPEEELTEYMLEESGSGFLSFENQNSKILMWLSFVIAILSYFLQGS